MFIPNPTHLKMLALALVASSSIGCTRLAVVSFSTDPTPAPAKPVVEQAASGIPEQSQETCEIHIRSHRGEVKAGRVPMTEGMTVQDVLAGVQVDRVFKRMTIELQRPTKKSHRPLKMPVTYSRKQKHVDPAYNYALQPGDRLVITEDTSTAFDDMLDGALDRIGMPPRR